MHFCNHILPGIVFLSAALVVVIAYIHRTDADSVTVSFKTPGSNTSYLRLISAFEIEEFDWQEQTFCLPSGKKQALHKQLMQTGLVDGIKFELRVFQEPIYTGMLTTALSPQKFEGVTINLTPRNPTDTKIKIEYATTEDSQADPRFNQLLEKTLKEQRLLK